MFTFAGFVAQFPGTAQGGSGHVTSVARQWWWCIMQGKLLIPSLPMLRGSRRPSSGVEGGGLDQPGSCTSSRGSTKIAPELMVSDGVLLWSHPHLFWFENDIFKIKWSSFFLNNKLSLSGRFIEHYNVYIICNIYSENLTWSIFTDMNNNMNNK